MAMQNEKPSLYDSISLKGRDATGQMLASERAGTSSPNQAPRAIVSQVAFASITSP
jgi:hypothetical protein